MPEPRARAGTYGVEEVAGILGMNPARIRRFVREGFLEPARGPRGALRFSFQDLVLLRLLRDLASARVPPRRVRRALDRLRAELPGDRSLAALRLGSAGVEVVVRDGELVWNAESGQYLLDFECPGNRAIAALPGPEAADPDPPVEFVMTADDWYRLGCELESGSPAQAREAYGRAIALDPEHADAHVNLGCLDQEAGKLEDAEAHCRAALRARPGHATAAFDLGVVLEDQGRLEEARGAYAAALEVDPSCADAHYNLARLFERSGDMAAVIRHLRAYHKLSRGA
jgi:tetratricopeptide (TPR) repeat protein